MKPDIQLTKKAGSSKIFLLYIFGSSLALYPPLSQYSLPFILFSFLAISISVFYDILFLNRAIPNSVLFKIVGALTFIYIVWLFIAVLHENDLSYALQDSLGFIIYLFLMPIFFIFIYINKLNQEFADFIVNLSKFIAGISLGVIVWYYLLFGNLQSESLVVINAFIKSIGLNWKVDNNAGFLGMYTYTAHILLLGIGLVFFRSLTQKKRSNLYLIFLFGFGVLADGHRALVVSMLLLFVLLIPLIKQKLSVIKLISYTFVLAIPLLAICLVNFEWIQDRFNFTSSDVSTLERLLQVPALIDKIAENPLFGNGFGAYANIIRSIERPFSYEVDFLATIMKLGLIGSIIYFGSYIFMIIKAWRSASELGYILFCVGISFFFYMGTNGNQAMSTDSSVFHMFLFILISLSVSPSNKLKRQS